MYLSRAYGCVVSSDLDLKLPPVDGDTPIDMTLRRADDGYDTDWDPDATEVMSFHRDDAQGHGSLSARTPGGYRLRFEGCCEFDLNPALDRIVWRLAPGADAGLVPIVAVGALMTLKFMLAGELVLHSSAVAVGGRGLAFVGRSGMGKSTMATVMCSAGATMVTDDVGRVIFDPDGVKLAAGGRESRLRASALSLADLMPSSDARRTDDGRLALSLPGSTLDTVPLDAVVVPLPAHNGTELELRPLGARDALMALAMFPRLPGLTDPAMQARQFERIGALAQRVPIFAASIPWSADTLDHRTAAALVGALGWDAPDDLHLTSQARPATP